jgi:hypothetical protein
MLNELAIAAQNEHGDDEIDVKDIEVGNRSDDKLV